MKKDSMTKSQIMNDTQVSFQSHKSTSQKVNTYNTLASSESVEKTVEALKAHNFLPMVVDTKEEALAEVIKLIPERVSVTNGASETLREIGFLDILKSNKHKWNNLHEAMLKESDRQKQILLRRQASLADYYLGSAHAISETGEIVFASATGSQLASLAFSSPNVILVVSTKKIMPTLSEAYARIPNHVLALEDQRARKVLGSGTVHAETLILHKDAGVTGRKIHIILVRENLGF